MAFLDGDNLFRRDLRGDSGKRPSQLIKFFRQMGGAEFFKRFPVQQFYPHDGARHFRKLLPLHSRRQRRADETADTGSCYNFGLNADFCERFDDADVGKSANRAAA